MKENKNGQTIKAVMAEIRRLDKKILLLQDEIAMLKSSCISGIIREYIKRKDKDLIKLSKYAEKMGIKNEVMNFVEVFYE